MTDKTISTYYDAGAIASAIKRGEHRNVIGGMWDEIGELQLAFLRKVGMTCDSHLLDIGCGSLRLGVRAVDYLNYGRYWGTDLNQALLEAGYAREIIPAGLEEKLPRLQLITDEEFQFKAVPNEIDFAIATSVFTHLPLNHLRLCLTNLGQHVKTPCTFLFTIFTPPDGLPVTQSHVQSRGGKVTHPHRDPFHYTMSDVQHAAVGTPWSITFVGDWEHPRNQMMVKAQKY